MTTMCWAGLGLWLASATATEKSNPAVNRYPRARVTGRNKISYRKQIAWLPINDLAPFPR